MKNHKAAASQERRGNAAKQLEGHPTKQNFERARARRSKPGSAVIGRHAPEELQGQATRKPRKAPVSTAALELDEVLRRIENGESIAGIAATLEMDRSTLTKWLGADDHRSARAREARSAAAAAFDEQAEQELRTATTPFELSKAKEVAHHLRWRASKINPKVYGDRPDPKGGERELTFDERIALMCVAPPGAHAELPPGCEI